MIPFSQTKSMFRVSLRASWSIPRTGLQRKAHLISGSPLFGHLNLSKPALSTLPSLRTSINLLKQRWKPTRSYYTQR